MKQFIEFVPVALFAAVFFYSRDIYLSTMVLMVGIAAQVAFEYLTSGRIEKKTQIIFWISMLFGGATLLFRNEVFIQWKPTIVNWLFAATLLASQLFGRENLLKKMLGAQMHLPAHVWQRLNLGWSLGFFIAGALNLVVAFNFTLEFWVSYKLIGGFAITLGYIVLTIAYLAKGGYLQEPQPLSDDNSVDDRNANDRNVNTNKVDNNSIDTNH
ncbi:MAG: intracellular septation protein [Cyclobacteriaceae bacterium]|jgi:intracellular septation protein